MCFLEQLRNLPTTQVSGPFLIVAPLSLVNQWQSECATWAPDLNVILYHGSASARQFLLDQEFYYTEQFVSKSTAQKLKRQHITKFQILITTYEVVMKDLNTLSKIRSVFLREYSCYLCHEDIPDIFISFILYHIHMIGGKL
jgi:chromodomain-helicase-DNA-binding protein 7